MSRINDTLALLTEEARSRHPMQLRIIPTLIVRPSRDLGQLASGQLRKFPPVLRFLLKGLGATHARGSDLLSYISFDSSYTNRLVELGFEDALAIREKIERFFGEDRRLLTK